MNRLEQNALSTLREYRPETLAMELRHNDVRDWLESNGYISWYPPIFGSNILYCITEKGKQFVKDNLP